MGGGDIRHYHRGCAVGVVSEETDQLRKEKASLTERVQKLAAIVNERHVTLWIYFGIAVFGELSERVDSEAAARLFGPVVLFCLSTLCATLWKGLLALKMVMSTAWANGKYKPAT